MNFLTFCDNIEILSDNNIFKLLGFAYRKVMPFMLDRPYQEVSEFKYLSELAYHEENVWNSIQSVFVPEYQACHREYDNGIRLVINEEVMTHRRFKARDFVKLLNTRKNGTHSKLNVMNVYVMIGRINCFVKNLNEEI